MTPDLLLKKYKNAIAFFLHLCYIATVQLNNCLIIKSKGKFV